MGKAQIDHLFSQLFFALFFLSLDEVVAELDIVDELLWVVGSAQAQIVGAAFFSSLVDRAEEEFFTSLDDHFSPTEARRKGIGDIDVPDREALSVVELGEEVKEKKGELDPLPLDPLPPIVDLSRGEAEVEGGKIFWGEEGAEREADSFRIDRAIVDVGDPSNGGAHCVGNVDDGG